MWMVKKYVRKRILGKKKIKIFDGNDKGEEK